MDFEEYRRRGKEMVDYIADYLENIRDRQVYPNVKPGYMRNLVPESAPLDGEDWKEIVQDVERVIMPGMTHWQSPHMHAYFPALVSFPSLLGDMLADAINCIGFTWASSPACTELETIVMNWLGKMIGLPETYLHSNSASQGGGVIQTTASESTLVCLLAGRTQAIQRFHEHTPGLKDAEINAKLVAYCSDQAHSSVEKAALIGLVRMRYIESDDNLSLRGKALKTAIEDDIKIGLIPFWVCATLGTTGACAFDNLDEVADVCVEHHLWLHVDAAYAGSAFLCPEHRGWLKGIEKADSISFNPSKWLMVHFDCTALWVKNSGALHRTFNVEPLYLQHENSGHAIDYMHWQIPLSKRFRALKLWFVIRNYGIRGLQSHIREGVRLAQKFEALVLADNRFEIPASRHLGLVVFRLKGENELTEKLLKRINHRGKIHCVPSSLKGKYVIRFTITSTYTTTNDILKDWNEIRMVTADIFAENVKYTADRARVSLKETREKNEAFGSSLLLANSPMSPKIVNGSFAAICDDPDGGEFVAKDYAGIRMAASQNSPAMRRRVRGILMSGKQFSLDSRIDLVIHNLDMNRGYKLGDVDSECAQPKVVEDVIAEDIPDREAYEPAAYGEFNQRAIYSPSQQLRAPRTAAKRPQTLAASVRVPTKQRATPMRPAVLPTPSNTALSAISNSNVPSLRTNSDDNYQITQWISQQNTAPNVHRQKSMPTDDRHLHSDTSKPILNPSPTQHPSQMRREKRLSDPQICYSFQNKFFEACVSRRFSHDACRMPGIAEFEPEEPQHQPQPVHWMQFSKMFARGPSLDGGSTDSLASTFTSTSSVATVKDGSTNRFKVRISDEWGRRINSIDSPGSDLFDEFGMDEMENVMVGDAFNEASPDSCHTQNTCCKKCGHSAAVLKQQFSSTFE